MKILSFTRPSFIFLISAITVMVSGCAQFNSMSESLGFTKSTASTETDDGLKNPVELPPPTPLIVPQAAPTPQETVKTAEASTKKKTTKPKTAKKAKKSKTAKAKTKKQAQPKKEEKPEVKETPAVTVPQTEGSSATQPVAEAPKSQKLKSSGKSELWCYRTLGAPDCFSTPQPDAASRLIGVNPPSSRPNTMEEYKDKVSEGLAAH